MCSIKMVSWHVNTEVRLKRTHKPHREGEGLAVGHCKPEVTLLLLILLTVWVTRGAASGFQGGSREVWFLFRGSMKGDGGQAGVPSAMASVLEHMV